MALSRRGCVLPVPMPIPMPMPKLMPKLTLTLMLTLLLVAMPAGAHRLSPGFFGLSETAAGRYDAQWKVSVSGGLADTLTPQLPAGCAVAGPPRVYFLDGVQAPNEFRSQHAAVLCDGPMAGGTFAIDGLGATDTDVLLRIDYLDGTSYTHRLVPDRPSVEIPERPGALDVIATYTVLGVEHILIGIDHLLFVLALLMLVTGWRRLVATITAFTVAHSITLGFATLGIVSVSSAAVEATIALSILFLATELARRDRRETGSRRDLAWRYPWIAAFAFGLLHGFGFAGVLADIGLPQQAVPLALLFFNVGVEIGQLLFIGAVLLLGFGLRRLGRDLPAFAPRFAVYVIGSVAALWVFERTLTAV
jgi:hydrogenase/urease accessory protein HupE